MSAFYLPEKVASLYKIPVGLLWTIMRTENVNPEGNQKLPYRL